MKVLLVVLPLFVTVLASDLQNSSKLRNEIDKVYNETNIEYGIAGGSKVTIDKIKYIASLSLSVDSKGLIGSAVILNKRWLLTAAENVYKASTPNHISIRTGSTFSATGGNEAHISNYFIYPNWKQDSWIDNLALVKLKKPTKFSAVSKPITISSKLPKRGEHVIVTGYGFDKDLKTFGHLQKAVVPFLDYKSCKTHYKEELLQRNNFCTLKKNVGPCLLDGGAPLVYKGRLIGIFSGSVKCGSTTYPPVYVDLTKEKYRKWIVNTIKKHDN